MPRVKRPAAVQRGWLNDFQESVASEYGNPGASLSRYVGPDKETPGLQHRPGTGGEDEHLSGLRRAEFLQQNASLIYPQCSARPAPPPAPTNLLL